MNAWDHLPNAGNIDRVLASLKANPGVWMTARGAAWEAAWMTARGAACNAAREAACNAALGAAWDAARNASRNAAWVAAWDAVGGAAWEPASSSLLALVAYDDCSHMLDSGVSELKILAAFGDPRAILLLPACIAFAKEK